MKLSSVNPVRFGWTLSTQTLDENTDIGKLGKQLHKGVDHIPGYNIADGREFTLRINGTTQEVELADGDVVEWKLPVAKIPNKFDGRSDLVRLVLNPIIFRLLHPRTEKKK